MHTELLVRSELHCSLARVTCVAWHHSLQSNLQVQLQCTQSLAADLDMCKLM